jgi:Flp pilus assembly protein TadD
MAASQPSKGHTDNYFHRALERAQVGDDQEAERLYRLAAAGGDLSAAFNLGNLLHRTGREQEAIAVYQRAATAGQADAAYNLARIFLDKEDLEEAEPLLRQAMDAGIVEAINDLAKVRLGRGDTAEAEALVRQAVAAGDQFAIFNLGLLLQARGAFDEAETWLQCAAAAGHVEASRSLARLRTMRRTRTLLDDLTWSRPLIAAGFEPSGADLLLAVGGVMAASRRITFSDGMPFLLAPTGLLIVQDRRIGLAVQDNTKIHVIQHSLDDARLMVSTFNALQVVWGRDAAVDGWTFIDLKVDTPEGQGLGDILHSLIQG